MEWNAQTPSREDLETQLIFNGNASRILKHAQPTDWGIEGNGGVDSVYSSAGGGGSASDMGYGSLSKNSISASFDTSSKEGTKISEYNFDRDDGFPKDFGKKKDLPRLEDTGSSPTLGASVCSGEPLIGLKLGKRTYFEDVSAGSSIKTSSFSAVPLSSPTTTKRSRASYQSTQVPRCQVDGCNLDLTSAKDYHRKHRVCDSHSKCPKVTIAGVERRFCQQCSRFHDLTEFDEKKRSCRRRLSDHNARRRKPQPEVIQSNSKWLSSSFYDGRQQMNLMLNRAPLVHNRPAPDATWDSSCGFNLTQTKGSLMRPAKAGGIDRQLHLPNNELPNAISTLHHDSDWLLPFKGTTAEVLSQGLEASVTASTLDATADLRRALSLLSTNSWGSNDTEPTSLDPLMHANHTSMGQPVMHVAPQGLPLASSEYWPAEVQPAESRVHPLTLHNNGSSQFKECQLSKETYDYGFFYPNHMN